MQCATAALVETHGRKGKAAGEEEGGGSETAPGAYTIQTLGSETCCEAFYRPFQGTMPKKHSPNLRESRKSQLN